jgi:hypothetical protein
VVREHGGALEHGHEHERPAAMVAVDGGRELGHARRQELGRQVHLAGRRAGRALDERGHAGFARS